jgi:hypothetical protein
MSSASSSPNTFTFGAPPANNVAGSGDPVQIFYASLRPTLLSYGEPFTMSAITSTNVAKLSISYDGVSLTLSQSAPGQWQASLPFTLIGSPSPAGTITLSLTAAKLDGRQTSVSIPVTIASRR